MNPSLPETDRSVLVATHLQDDFQFHNLFHRSGVPNRRYRKLKALRDLPPDFCSVSCIWICATPRRGGLGKTLPVGLGRARVPPCRYAPQHPTAASAPERSCLLAEVKSLQAIQLRESPREGAFLLFVSRPTLGQRLKPRTILQECHPDSSDRPVSLFGNNDFSLTLQFGIILLVDFLAEDEHN